MNKRLFISIPIPNQIKNQLQWILKQIDTKDIRWTLFNNLHITVYFLGSVEEGLIPILVEHLHLNFSEIKKFRLKFEKILFVPSKKPRMIWAQFYKNKEYENLYKTISNVIQQIINETSKRNNKELIPHITLARFSEQLNVNELTIKQPNIDDLIIDSCQLMESNIIDDTRIYSTIAKFKFD